MLRERPEARASIVTASIFAEKFADASERDLLEEFQKSYHDLDLLVLEDLQHLVRQRDAQRQLITILDEIQANGGRMIISSRTPPGELEGLLPRLANRLHAAASAAIRLPGQASRESLLSHFAKTRQIAVPISVIRLLAETYPLSPSELLGLLRQLEAAAASEKVRIDLSFTRRFLDSDTPLNKATLNDIAKTVARHFDIPLTRLRSRARMQELVFPRQCAMFLARELTAHSLVEIGRYFSNRDHSTVVHSCNRVSRLLPEQPDVRHHLTQIRRSLGAS